MQLVGVVVIYHPREELINNIKSYLSELKYLLVVDNTERRYIDDYQNIYRELIKLPNVGIYQLNENKGMAFALNLALNKCLINDYLLTMDQDSAFIFDEGYSLKNYLLLVEKEFTADGVAIVAPNYQGDSCFCSKTTDVLAVITSGAVVKCRYAKEINGYNEDLFIDEVDNEFCYRIRKRGYRIRQIPYVMRHSIGNPKKIRVCGLFSFVVANHNYQRKYYIVKNRCYMFLKYHELMKAYLLSLIKIFIKTLFFEKDRMRKIQYMLLGICDAIQGKWGRKFD